MDKRAPKVVPVLIVVLMILFTAFMVGNDLVKDKEVKEWDTVPVTINRVERTNSTSKSQHSRIYVSYEYNGVQYSDMLVRGDGVLMESGDQYYAKVNPQKPTQVSTVKNIFHIISDYGFVVLFALVCITVLVLFFAGDKSESQNE